jgi:uncharacterized protein (DUF1697 family)
MSIIYVALLRGINVGGNGIISMKDLKVGFEKAGFKNVVTYINSGNVVFQSSEKDPRKVEKKIETMLAKEYDFVCKVVVRNQAEIEKLLKSVPKSWKNTDRKCNVIFLRHAIDSKDILKGLSTKSDIEEVVYKPGVLFWSALTGDLGQSTMIKLSSKPIYKEMTVRNLNTTKKIFELMSKMAP